MKWLVKTADCLACFMFGWSGAFGFHAWYVGNLPMAGFQAGCIATVAVILGVIRLLARWLARRRDS